jgi:hypothetical protein
MLTGNPGTPAPVEGAMRRTLIVLWLAGTLLPLWTVPSWACSCAAVSKQDLARTADVVFTGEVDHVERAPRGIVASLTIDAVYKGGHRGTADVSTEADGASCGFDFHAGRRYTVFAYRDSGRLHTSICSGTTQGDIVPERFGLEEAVSLVPIGVPDGPVDRAYGWPPVLAAVLALVTTTALVVLRRRAAA